MGNMMGHVQRVNPETGKLQYLIKVRKTITTEDDEGNPQTRTKFVKQWKDADQIDYNKDDLVERDIADELAKAEDEKQVLTSTKTQLQNKYNRNEHDVLKIDELEHENTKIKAYNKAMGDVKYDDKTAEIAKLEYEIKETQEKINDKWASKADVNKYLRHITELQNKKTALETEFGMIKEDKVSDEQIQKHAKAANDVADTEAKINKRRTKNAAVDKFEADTEQLEFSNSVKQKVLDAMNDKSNEDNVKAIANKRLSAEQKEKELAAQQAEKNAEEKMNIEKWQEEALNSPEVQASNAKIKQAYINKAQYEDEAKASERLRNAQIAERDARIMAQVYAEQNSTFTSSNKLTEAETLHTLAKEKYNDAVNDIRDEGEYVHNKVNLIRARLTDDLPFADKINEKLNERGFNIEDQDWFANNLKSRVAVDSFTNAADIIRSAYDPEQGWNDDMLNGNEDLENYLDRAGFTLKK